VNHWIHKEDDSRSLLKIRQQAIPLPVMSGLVTNSVAQVSGAPHHRHGEHDELPTGCAKGERHIHVTRDQDVGGPTPPERNGAPQYMPKPDRVAAEAQEPCAETSHNQELKDLGQMRRAMRRSRQLRGDVRRSLYEIQPHTVDIHAPGYQP
jgi:hypothetical protein